MAKKKKDENQQQPQDMFPPEMIDNLRGFGDEVNVAKEAIDAFNQNLNRMNVQLQKMTEAVVTGNRNVARETARNIPRAFKDLGGSIKRETPKLEIGKVGELKVEKTALETSVKEFVNRGQRVTERSFRPIAPRPDILDIFQPDYLPSETLKRPITQKEAPQYGGEVGRLLREDLIKNFRQLGHTLSPFSFAQYSAMFGVMWPLQLKMSETITRPVTDTLMPFNEIKTFAKGFAGLGTSLEGFMQELKKSPLQMYEGLYQSKIMLGSALGGERAANQTINNALKLAREYPIRTEEILSSLTRLAVYPQVKPYLQNEQFQRKLMETVAGLGMIVPEQGVSGAMFSLVEALSGSWRSLQMRFNVSPEVVQQLSGMTKAEMSSSPERLVEGLHRFVSKSIGLDVMEKQKYTFTKQVENFGDALQMLTKDVFETTGLYKTITAGATMFQTGFSALAGSQQFLGYIGDIFKPYQEMTNQAFARFAGIPVGMYQQTPLTNLTQIIEENFKSMSMEEIGQRFRNLINDMADVQENMATNINKVVNTAFGMTLSDIGDNISNVVGQEFADLSMNVIKAFGKNMIANPMDMLQVMGTIAIPTLALLGGAQLATAAGTRQLEKMPLKQRVLNQREAQTGFASFRTKQEMFTGIANLDEGRMLFIPKMSAAERALQKGDVNTYLQKTFEIARENYIKNTIEPVNKAMEQLKNFSYGQLEGMKITGKTELNTKKLKSIVDEIMKTEVRGKFRTPYMEDLDLVSNFKKIGDFLKEVDVATQEQMKARYGITSFKGMNINQLKAMITKRTGLAGKLFAQSSEFRKLYQAGMSEKALEDFVEAYVTNRVREEVERAYIKNPKGALNYDTIMRRVKTLFTSESGYVRISPETRKILENIPSQYGKEVEVGGKAMRIARITPAISSQNISLYRKVAEEYAQKGNTKEVQAIRKALAEFDAALRSEGGVIRTSHFRQQAGNVIDSMREIDTTFDKILAEVPDITKNKAEQIRTVLKQKTIGGGITKPFTAGMTYSDLMGIITTGEGSEKYMNVLKKRGVNIQTLLDNQPISMFIDDINTQAKQLSQFQLTGDLEGMNKFISDTEKGIKELNKLFTTSTVEELAQAAPTFKERMMLKGIQSNIGMRGTALGQLAEEQKFMSKPQKFMIKGGAILDVLFAGLSGANIAKNLGIDTKVGASLGALAPLALTGATMARGGGFKALLSGRYMGAMAGLMTALSMGESVTEGYKQIENYRKSVNKWFDSVKTTLKPEDYQLIQNFAMPASYFDITSATRHQAGMENVRRNMGGIIGGAGLGMAAMAGLGLLTGGIALMPILGMGLLAGGGGMMASYLSGRGQATPEEQFRISATEGFVGQYKIYSKALDTVSQQITKLEQVSKVGSLTYAESFKLQQLYAERGTLKTMKIASIEGIRNIAEIAGVKVEKAGLLADTGKYGYTYGERGFFTPAPKSERFMYQETAKFAGYLQNLNKRFDKMTIGEQLGAAMASNVYMTDVLMPKIKEGMISPDKEEQRLAFTDYNRVMTGVLTNLGKIGENINIKDVNQTMAYSKLMETTLSNIVVPPQEQGKALEEFTKTVMPQVGRFYFKSYLSESFAEDNRMKDIYARIGQSSKAIFSQLGISASPEQILTMGREKFVAEYAPKTKMTEETLTGLYNNIQKQFSDTFSSIDISKSLDKTKSNLEMKSAAVAATGVDKLFNNIVFSRQNLSGAGKQIGAQEGYTPILQNQGGALLANVGRDITIAKTAADKIAQYQAKVQAGGTLTPQEMEDLNSNRELLNNTMSSLNNTFNTTKELLNTKVNSSLEKFSKAVSLASTVDTGTYTDMMRNVFSEMSNTIKSAQLSSEYKRIEAAKDLEKVQPYLEKIGLKGATIEDLTKRGPSGMTAYEEALIGKTPAELKAAGFTPEIQSTISKIQANIKQSEELATTAQVAQINFARQQGVAAMGVSFLGQPEMAGIDMFTRNRWNLREKAREAAGSQISELAQMYSEATTKTEKIAIGTALMKTFQSAQRLGLDNTYMQTRFGDLQKGFQEDFVKEQVNAAKVDTEIVKMTATLGQMKAMPMEYTPEPMTMETFMKTKGGYTNILNEPTITRTAAQPQLPEAKIVQPIEQQTKEVANLTNIMKQEQKPMETVGKALGGGAGCINICGAMQNAMVPPTSLSAMTQENIQQLKAGEEGLISSLTGKAKKSNILDALGGISAGLFGFGVMSQNPYLMGIGAAGSMAVGIGKFVSGLFESEEVKPQQPIPQLETPEIKQELGVEAVQAKAVPKEPIDNLAKEIVNSVSESIPTIQPETTPTLNVQQEAIKPTEISTDIATSAANDAQVAAQGISDSLATVANAATLSVAPQEDNPNYYLGPMGIG